MDEIPNPARYADTEDKLMFVPAKNGQFTLKRAYRLLYGLIPEGSRPVDQPQYEFWQRFWSCTGVIPRVKVFIWKSIHKAILVGATLNVRILAIDPICKICGKENETINHMLFQCDLARVVWFMSPLSIRADQLQGSLMEILAAWMDLLDEDSFYLAIYVMWGGLEISMCLVVWRKERNPQVCAILCNLFDEFGSAMQGEGGAAYVITSHERSVLTQYGLRGERAFSTLQMEALALLIGMKAVISMGYGECTFLTDSKNLETALKSSVAPVSTDWRAHGEVMETWGLLGKYKDFKIKFVNREEVGTAHSLANLGRTSVMDYVGHSFPLFSNSR